MLTIHFKQAGAAERKVIMPLISSSKLVQIPVPRFVVFYNGTQEQPESRLLKLSDAFEKEVTSPELELSLIHIL